MLYSALISGVLLSLSYGQTDTYPGYAVHLSKKGLDFGSTTGGKAIVTTFRTTEIPTFSIISEDVAKLDVGNITVTRFDGERWYYDLKSPNLIRYGLNGANIEIDGTFLGLVHVIIVPDFNVGGNMKITASNVSLSIQIQMQIDEEGRPILNAVDCGATIQGFDLKLSGSAFAWVLDLFHKLISESIKPKIGSAICDAASKAINGQLKDIIQKLPSPVPIYKGFDFDYQLQEVNVAPSTGMDLSGLGVIDYNGKTGGLNGNPLDRNTTNLTNKMGYVYVSDNVLQSASNIAHEQGILDFTVNEQTVPAAKNFLKTTCPGALCLGSLIKELATDYPSDTCSARIFTTNPPQLVFSSSGMSLTITGLRMDLGIFRPNGVDNFAGATINMTASIVPEVSSSKINGTIKIGQLVIQEQFSTLHDKINWIFIQNYGKYLLGNELSTLLEKGYNFPDLEGVEFVGPAVVFRSHTMEVSTDLAYTPKPGLSDPENPSGSGLEVTESGLRQIIVRLAKTRDGTGFQVSGWEPGFDQIPMSGLGIGVDNPVKK